MRMTDEDLELHDALLRENQELSHLRDQGYYDRERRRKANEKLLSRETGIQSDDCKQAEERDRSDRLIPETAKGIKH